MTTTPNEPVSDSDIETTGAPAGTGLGDTDADSGDSGDTSPGKDGPDGGGLDTQDETDADSSDA